MVTIYDLVNDKFIKLEGNNPLNAAHLILKEINQKINGRMLPEEVDSIIEKVNYIFTLGVQMEKVAFHQKKLRELNNV